MKNLWQKLTVGLGLGLLYFWPILAYGQTCPTGTTAVGGTCVPNNAGFAGDNIDRVSQGVTFVLNILLTIVGLVAVLFIVIGGYKYVTSNGDPEQIESAKGTIMNALIGVAVVLLALAIVRIVANAVGNNV